MSKFAKLFDLENGSQVLVTREHDEDREAPHGVAFRTYLDEIKATMTMWFEDEARADEVLEKYTLNAAETFRKNVFKDLEL